MLYLSAIGGWDSVHAVRSRGPIIFNENAHGVYSLLQLLVVTESDPRATGISGRNPNVEGIPSEAELNEIHSNDTVTEPMVTDTV
jgi:hypothetical protein